MNKLLIVCGPTAVGKTPVALSLAEKFDGELISADSRQVYRGMDIGTGKDVPKGFHWKAWESTVGYWEGNGGVRIWGYDLLGPKEEFSVSDYIVFARKVIKNVWTRGKMPILVGGTGFYIKGVVDGIETIGTKKDAKLRKELSKRSVSELFKILSDQDSQKADSLNSSDRKNPRRLVRAIEIAKSNNLHGKSIGNLECDFLFLGLKAPKDVLRKNIEKRVRGRLKEGIVAEVNSLLSKGVDWTDPSMTATGYRQLQDYLSNEKTLDEFIKEWSLSETQYAKRQMTWFRKEKRIVWFDTGRSKYKERIEKLVLRWYSSSSDVGTKN